MPFVSVEISFCKVIFCFFPPSDAKLLEYLFATQVAGCWEDEAAKIGNQNVSVF